MNILLTLFLLFLVILLLMSNIKYKTKFRNYYEKNKNDNSVIVKNYIPQILKYIFERKNLDENKPIKFYYDYDRVATGSDATSSNGATSAAAHGSTANAARSDAARSDSSNGTSESIALVKTDSDKCYT